MVLCGAFGNVTASYEGEMALPMLLRERRWLTLARVMAGLRREGRGLAWSGWRALGPLLSARHQELVIRLLGRDRLSYEVLRDTGMAPDYFADHALAERASERGWELDGRLSLDGRARRLRTLGRIDGGYQRAALNASHGVDLRDPTSDRRVIELTLAIPEEHFVHEGRPAAVFRDAMAGILPEQHLARRVRGLQSADWYEGVVAARDELAAHVERLARSPLAGRMLDIPRLRAAIAELPNSDTPVDQLAEGNWGATRAVRRHGAALLRAMNIGAFILRTEPRNDEGAPIAEESDLTESGSPLIL